MIYMTLLYIIFLGYAEFFETKGAKSLEIINESVFVLIMYNFVLLNNLVSEMEIRYKAGDAIILMTAGLLIINMFVIIFVSVKALSWKCRLRKLKNKAIKEYNKKIEEMQIRQSLKPIEAELKKTTPIVP